MYGGSDRRAGKAMRDRCPIAREVSWVKQGSNLWLPGNRGGSKSHCKGRQGSCTENKLAAEASGQHTAVVASHLGICKIWWDSDSFKREWKGGSSICTEQIVKLQNRKHERTRCHDSFTQTLKYLVQNAKY